MNVQNPISTQIQQAINYHTNRLAWSFRLQPADKDDIDFKRRRLYTDKTAVLLGQLIQEEKHDKQTKQTDDSTGGDALHGD